MTHDALNANEIKNSLTGVGCFTFYILIPVDSIIKDGLGAPISALPTYSRVGESYNEYMYKVLSSECENFNTRQNLLELYKITGGDFHNPTLIMPNEWGNHLKTYFVNEKEYLFIPRWWESTEKSDKGKWNMDIADTGHNYMVRADPGVRGIKDNMEYRGAAAKIHVNAVKEEILNEVRDVEWTFYWGSGSMGAIEDDETRLDAIRCISLIAQEALINDKVYYSTDPYILKRKLLRSNV